MKKTKLDQTFYKTMMTIAIPIVIQNIISIGAEHGGYHRLASWASMS